MQPLPQLLNMAIVAAINAGQEILKIYDTNFKVETKSDNTPVTLADKAASNSIIKDLAASQINVLSEEGELFAYEKRKNWNTLWITDPLDGTKEFVKRNGEFTVNIALIENQKPIIGVIYSPVFRHLYYASTNSGSFKVSGHKVLAEINSGQALRIENILSQAKQLPLCNYPENYTVIASRSHLSKQVSARLDKLKHEKGKINVVNTGSSIKFCLIAEGLAHEYPRFGNTMEWDTAAGQCIVEQTGGRVIDLKTNEPIIYNRENLMNSDFIAFCKN